MYILFNLADFSSDTSSGNTSGDQIRDHFSVCTVLGRPHDKELLGRQHALVSASQIACT
jgi:hypothetical protein